MKITLTTHHGDGTTSTLDFDTDRTDTLLAAIEELVESPAVVHDHEAVVSIGIRHDDARRPVLVLGTGAF